VKNRHAEGLFSPRKTSRFAQTAAAVNSPEVIADNGMLTLANGHSKEDSSRAYK
jgi:hypothetical protein